MPWQSGSAVRNNGTFAGSQVWQDDAAAGTKILASNHDNHDQDLADMITECLHRGGQNAMLANIDWGGFRILNLADPVGAQDAATKAYIDTEISTLSGTLSTVATTGDYDDLTNKPGAAQGSVLKADPVVVIPISFVSSTLESAMTSIFDAASRFSIRPATGVNVGGNEVVFSDTGTYRAQAELDISCDQDFRVETKLYFNDTLIKTVVEEFPASAEVTARAEDYIQVGSTPSTFNVKWDASTVGGGTGNWGATAGDAHIYLHQVG